MVRRSSGGAELVKNSSQILPFSTRAHQNISAKKTMARKAAKLVPDGSIVFLDQSSSAFFVACELQSRADLTVVTNNVEIVSLLSQSELEVISSGGRLSHSNRNCLLGSDTQHLFSQIRADVAFFSTKALSPDGIAWDCDREEVCMRTIMLENAAKKVYLCTAEKFGQYAGYRQCSLEDVDCMITEAEDTSLFAPLGKLIEKII
jgi:DeoR/GlpR family transcriptional regulator of sugar metabolism